MTKRFRKPSEMRNKPGNRVPVSTRLREPLKKSLVQWSKQADLSLGEFIEKILEDYAEFLEDEKSK